MQRRRFCFGLSILACLIFVYVSYADATVIEQVLVVLDGEPYTLTNFKEYARTQMGRDFPAGDLSRLGKEDQEVVEQFITEKLMAAEVKQAGIKVSEEDIDNYISQIKEKNRINDEQLRAALKQEGVSWEKYRGSIRAEIEKSDIVDSQVRKKINITPEDVERYYTLNQKKYIAEERVHLRHILISAPDAADPAGANALEKAAEIRRRALAGEDFAKLAQSYSEGAGASEGGDIGWVTRGTMLKEIDQLAFGKLSVGEISEPIRAGTGIHLIKLEAREGGRQLPLAEIREKVREEVISKALEERFKKWLKGDLRKKHRVDVKLPGVVFRPEETGEGTMDSLVASGSRKRNESSGFWDFINPFKSTPAEETDEKGEPTTQAQAGQNVISLFGTPLFRTESADDADTVDEVLAPVEDQKNPEQPKESGGFWSRLNPFSK